MSKITLAAFSDHGRCAPTRAHAKPSRIRYLARVLTESGISERDAESIQRQSFPVGPDGSMGWFELEDLMIAFEKIIELRSRKA